MRFADGLIYRPTNWHYCDGYDRRYWREVLDGIPPAGAGTDKLSTSGVAAAAASQPPIPNGTLDTGEGYYDPRSRETFSYDGQFMRTSDDDEHAWVLRHCARQWDAEIGERPRNRYDGMTLYPQDGGDAWRQSAADTTSNRPQQQSSKFSDDALDVGRGVQLSWPQRVKNGSTLDAAWESLIVQCGGDGGGAPSDAAAAKSVQVTSGEVDERVITVPSPTTLAGASGVESERA